MPPATREKPAEAAGRGGLLHPHPARSRQLMHHHEEEAEEGQEEEKKHGAQRGLEHRPNITIPVTISPKAKKYGAQKGRRQRPNINIPPKENTSTRECPAVHHRSNSVTDDPSQPTALVGTAEVWATLQLAKSRKHCGAKPCCHVSTMLFLYLWSEAAYFDLRTPRHPIIVPPERHELKRPKNNSSWPPAGLFGRQAANDNE